MLQLQNFGHIAKECWAKGGGAEGKGPKGKGKGKEVAVKAEEKSGSDSDAVWMVSMDDEGGMEADDKVIDWLCNVGGGDESECELWTEEEINNNNEFAVVDYSPETSSTESDLSSYDVDVNEFFSETTVSDDDVNTIPDLESVSESSEGSIYGADKELSDEALDLGEEPKTVTLAAAVLANSVSTTIETELFDSGTSRHMSPYRHKFINYSKESTYCG